MQVFLPYDDFAKSVSVLDPKRLGNQIYRECKTLVKGGWPNHPVAKMWEHHKIALCQYAIAGLEELRSRGRNYPHHFKYFRNKLRYLRSKGHIEELPSWVGSRKFHESHRSNLLRKDPEHYRKFWPKLRDDLPYVWPVGQ